jgi:hypothetical protein
MRDTLQVRYPSYMSAHLRRTGSQASAGWLTVWLSSDFEDASCVPPPGYDLDAWTRPWVHPTTPQEALAAIETCLSICPAVGLCRTLVSLSPEPPQGVIQAGIAIGLGVGMPKRLPPVNRQQQQWCSDADDVEESA